MVKKEEILKRLLPLGILAAADALLQPSGLLYSPSIFTQNYACGEPPALNATLLKCPACGCQNLHEETERLTCPECAKNWSKAEGIYDFREPL